MEISPHDSNRLTWLVSGLVSACCPNCGGVSQKQPVLSAALPNARAPDARAVLLACDNCGCGFFELPDLVDYTQEPVGGSAALAFYLQQGAGLWGIDSALQRLDMPPGTTLLEVGCGFGFGLDFAIHALDWQVLGLDPSPLARAGRELLGLPILHRHLVAGEDCGGPYDVIMASELIEHVPDPGALLTTLRQALKPDGVLILSTPNFAWVRPETPPGLLTPLLSAGYHIVLQSERSLRAVLRRAGFPIVEVDVLGPQLVARASGVAARWNDAPPDRVRYRDYLEQAMRRAELGSDLWWGFAGRAYREAVQAADQSGAAEIFGVIRGASQDRYGSDLEAWHTPSEPPCLTLEQLVTREPLCLGPLLLHRGYQRLTSGETRDRLRSVFDEAARAAGRLRRTLQHIGTDDGDAEDVEWVAHAEVVLCAAYAGARDILQRLDALGPAPGDLPGDRRRDIIRKRCFVEMVNAGHYQAALALQTVVPPLDRSVELADHDLDALFCGAVLDIQHPDGDVRQALSRAAALRERCSTALQAGVTHGSPQILLWPALQLEVLALHRLGEGDAAERHRAMQVVRLSQLPGASAPPPNLAVIA